MTHDSHRQGSEEAESPLLPVMTQVSGIINFICSRRWPRGDESQLRTQPNANQPWFFSAAETCNLIFFRIAVLLSAGLAASKSVVARHGQEGLSGPRGNIKKEGPKEGTERRE